MQLHRALRQTLDALQQAGLTHISRASGESLLAQRLVTQAQASETSEQKAVPAAQTAASTIRPQSSEPRPQTADVPRQGTGSTHPQTPLPMPSDPVPRDSGKSRPLEGVPPREERPNVPLASPALILTPKEPPLRRGVTTPQTMKRKDREAFLSALSQKVAQCVRCEELARTRTQTVFGIGNPEAQVMLIGEAPGADEDKQGEPFVGRAGKLLNDIIKACGWTREELYICNILRCRPPGNRNPTPIEADNCREYLDKQIEIVDPDYIICLGTIAAQNLLSETTPIGRLRGKLFEYGRAKVLCTYHPSYLLRNPPAKKLVWEDLKFLLREMGIDPDAIKPKKQ